MIDNSNENNNFFAETVSEYEEFDIVMKPHLHYWTACIQSEPLILEAQMFQFLLYSDGVESGNGTHISLAIKRYVEPMLKLYVPSKVEFEIKMLHS